MDDRLVRGYIAGAVGGIVMAALNYILFKLGYAEVRYVDLVGVVLFGYTPNTLGAIVTAQVIQWGHAALMGIGFAYLIPLVTSRYITFKGMTYGVIIWFLTFGVGALLKVPLYTNLSWTTPASHLFTSSVWGAVAALSLVWMGEGYSCQVLASPACKRYADENDKRLAARLERQEKLLVQVINNKQAGKRSWFSRLKFW